MDSKAPFLVLPDYRKDLILEYFPGHPTGSIITDLSGNGNVITKEASPVREDGGLLAPVLNFDTQGGIEIADKADQDLGATTKRTFMFLAKFASFASSGNVLFHKGGNNYAMGITTSGDNCALYMYLMDDEEAQEFEFYDNSVNCIFANTWHLIAFTLDNAVVGVNGYVDGELKMSKNRSGTGRTYNSSHVINQGIDSYANNMDGQIAMTRVYDSVLSASQIKQVYQYIRRYVMGVSPKL